MNKKFWGVVTTVAFALNAFCQNPDAEKYAALISPKTAKKHLSILASDAFEGRETGKPGAERAAQYIATEFRRLGLKPPVNKTYFQNVPLVENRLEVKSFTVNSTAYKNGVNFYLSGNPGTQTVKTSEIVFAGYGISSTHYDDLKGTDISGKVVLVFTHGEPVKNGISAVTQNSSISDWSDSPSMRIKNLLARKPAMILLVSPDVEPILKEYSRHFTEGKISIKSKTPQMAEPAVPLVNITPGVADELLSSTGSTLKNIQSEIDDSGAPRTRTVKTSLNVSIESKSMDVKASNVLGYLEGSDLKDEVLVISAHYDHIGLNPGGADKVFNGADDDGSGTTAVLEIAKAFAKAKKEGKGPRRSILFLGNVAEEKGLLGSRWYTDNPVFPLSSTIANLNIDMIGRIDPIHAADTNYCYLVGSDKLSTELHNISENANATYTKFKLDYKYNDPNDPDRIYYRSDHYNFARYNVPVIFYFNGIHEDYHKPGDEVDKIDFNLLTRRAQLVFYTSWELVNRDGRPRVDFRSDTTNSR